jgi:hypothetical protein
VHATVASSATAIAILRGAVSGCFPIDRRSDSYLRLHTSTASGNGALGASQTITVESEIETRLPFGRMTVLAALGAEEKEAAFSEEDAVGSTDEFAAPRKLVALVPELPDPLA